MDQAISEWISQHLSKFMAYVAVAFTWLSEFGLVVILFSIIMAIYYGVKQKKLCITFTFGLVFFGICWLLVDGAGFLPFAIKLLVKRERPYHVIDGFEQMMDAVHYRHPSSYSFPSGHTLTAFYLATIITLRWKKWGYLAYPLAVLVAFSRVWLGAHYFSDVLVGALLGSIIAIGTYYLSGFIAKKFEEKGKTYAIR